MDWWGLLALIASSASAQGACLSRGILGACMFPRKLLKFRVYFSPEKMFSNVYHRHSVSFLQENSHLQLRRKLCLSLKQRLEVPLKKKTKKFSSKLFRIIGEGSRAYYVSSKKEAFRHFLSHFMFLSQILWVCKVYLKSEIQPARKLSIWEIS